MSCFNDDPIFIGFLFLRWKIFLQVALQKAKRSEALPPILSVCGIDAKNASFRRKYKKFPPRDKNQFLNATILNV